MTTHKLGDGSLTIEDDAVVLTFAGALTQSVKKKASPRRIPFAAIRDVELKKPGVGGGYLRFVLAGSDESAKFKKDFDLNTLTLAVGKTYKEAASIEEALRQRVAGEAATPHPDLLPEPSAAPIPAFVPTGDRKADKKALLAHQASAGGARPDIAAAAGRMGWTFGGKREIRKLHEHVHDGELVQYIAQGTYVEHQGIVVLTDQRLIFVFHGLVQQVVEDFPLDRITAVSSKSGMGSGSLVVHTGGAQSVISSIIKTDLKHFLDALRVRLSAGPTGQPSAPSPAAPDVMSQLSKLGELKDSGILTQEEFDSKKAELLSRL
jgi:hypothetical protein